MNQSNKINPYSPTVAILIIAGLLLLGTCILYGFFALMNLLLSPGASSPGTPTTPVGPILFIPTPDCGPPTLVLGSTTFQIQTLTSTPDGLLNIPPDTTDIAYWVEGTNNNYIFGLSSTPENLALTAALAPGSTATVGRNNCNSTTYTLFALEQNPVNISALLDQSTEGITIFLPTDSITTSIVIRGGLTGEQISVINTPSGTEIQAEISLLETTTSADGSTISIGVSVYNGGQAEFTLSASDVSLTQPEGTPLVLVKSKPRLPEVLKPGETETIEFTFTRPASPTALLKILGIEYDIEGY